MKSQVLANWNLPTLSTFALILFVSIFVVMLLMIYRKGSKSIYSEASQLPLTEGDVNNER